MADGGAGVGQQGVQPRTKTKKPVSPTRNIVSTVVLVVLVGILGMEVYARVQMQTARTRVEKRLEQEDKDLPSIEEVNQMVGKAPVASGEDREGTRMTYQWRGVFRSYGFTGLYNRQNPPHLKRIE